MHARVRNQNTSRHTFVCIFPPVVHALVRSFSAPSPFALFTAVSLRLPLMPHSEHEHPESASLDTAAEYSAPRSPSCSPFLSPSLSSPTLNSPDPPPPTHPPPSSSLASVLGAQFLPASLCSSPQLFRRRRIRCCCLCSLCSTFIKGLSSDSPSYNT